MAANSQQTTMLCGLQHTHTWSTNTGTLHSELRNSTLWHSSNSCPINIHPAPKCWRHTNCWQTFQIWAFNTQRRRTPTTATQSFQTLIHWLAHHYTGRHSELRNSTLWHSDAFVKQLSNKHSSGAEILETHKLNSAIQHTEIPHRGIEYKRSHHKNDIKATQSFPKQTLITDILQTDI